MLEKLKKLAHSPVPMWRLLISLLKTLGRLKCPSGLLTSQQVDVFMSVYRYKLSKVHLSDALLDEGINHMATIERELIKKVKKVKSDISKDSTKLNEIESAFQRDHFSAGHLVKMCLYTDSIHAVAHERVTEIQCVVDRVREYTESRKFYAMKQAVEDAISRIQVFHDEFSLPLPIDIFTILATGINTHLSSLEAMKIAVENVIKIQSFPDTGSEIEVLRVWAENLESFAEEFEDNQEFFSSEVFSSLEVLATQVVLKCRVKKPLANGSEQEVYRRRVRYAAGFLLNVIEASQEEAEEEDSEVIASLSLMSGLTLNDILSCEEGESCRNQSHKKN